MRFAARDLPQRGGNCPEGIPGVANLMGPEVVLDGTPLLSCYCIVGIEGCSGRGYVSHGRARAGWV